MGLRLLNAYAWLGPLLLTPLSLWLWWNRQPGPLALVAWAVPIAWAYLVPAVGTNLLQVWELRGPHRWGRFRPYHGFVFGSATSLISALVLPLELPHPLLTGLVLACVLGWVNLIYDLKALQHGVLRVYNQPWAEGRGHEAVVMDYAPWFFGGFGFSLGLALASLQRWGPGWQDLPLAFLGTLALTVALPVLGYMQCSRRRHGHWGIRPIGRLDATPSD